jgi:ATP-dependent exoDNAse (exonuclease V) beta subunit
LVEKEEFNIFYVAITRAKEAVFLDSDYYDTFSNCIQNKETSKELISLIQKTIEQSNNKILFSREESNISLFSQQNLNKKRMI